MPENQTVPPDPAEKARLRAKQKVDFLGHLTVYVVGIAFLVLVNLRTNPGHLWVVWPMFGWGIAILFHFMGTFVFAEGSAVQRWMLERELRHAPR